VRQSEVTNYEVNKLVRHTIQPKGTIRRLSVAVILDHQTVYEKSKDGKAIARSVPRSQKDLDAYRDLVLAAVGFNEQRGDVVSIENVAFYSESIPEEAQPAIPWHTKWQGYLLPAMKYGAFIVLFLIVYLIFLRPIRKRVLHAMSNVGALGPGGTGESSLRSENAAKALPGSKTEEIPAPASGAPASLPAGEGGLPEEIISMEAVSDEQIERELIREANAVDMGGRKFAAMKKKLVDKAKKDPEMVSQLIRSLLRERA
jgi:flagellar biosynthesis/type III secretory pathway M-ring protein FliF/YscJ